MPQRDGYLIIRPGTSGKLRTSTRYFTGRASDEFYYASPESMVRLEITHPGGGGLVWGGGSYFQTDNDSERVWDLYFIGTEQAYASARKEGPPEPLWPDAEAADAQQ